MGIQPVALGRHAPRQFVLSGPQLDLQIVFTQQKLHSNFVGYVH
jgi:hypothetical protein